MSKLINCPKCGKLFLSTKWDFCDSCYQKHVELIEGITKFVKMSEEPTVHINKIIEKFNIPAKEFESYLSAGKFIPIASKMVFNCRSCEELTTAEGCFSFVCPKCSRKIKEDVGPPKVLKKITKPDKDA